MGGRACGVVVERDGALEEIAAGEVVLCGGSIQTPALLWRSGVGPPEELAALGIETAVANAAVGANLTDHPGVFYFMAPGAHAVPFSEPQYQLGTRYTSTDSADVNDMFLSLMNYWDLQGSRISRPCSGWIRPWSLRAGCISPNHGGGCGSPRPIRAWPRAST